MTIYVFIYLGYIVEKRKVTGAYSGICPGGLKFFYLSMGAQLPLGPENTLKSIDFIGPRGFSPQSPPLNRPLGGDIPVMPNNLKQVTSHSLHIKKYYA